MKPFTSKHCMQYLTKESPFRQEEELADSYKPKGKNKGLFKKELTDKPKVKTDRQPKKTYKDVNAKKLKKEYRKKTGPTGIAPEKQKFVPTKK